MGETGMDHPHREVVQVGVSGARIVAVTHQRIDYIDMAGQARSVDLEACARGWGRWHDEHRGEFLPLPGSSEQGIAAWNARCVGERGALDNPPWAEFRNERATRFVFETRDALYRELLTPLGKAGWHTFDTD
jgi:hypothetical protein